MTMGTDTWAEVIFPPSPATFYGAIRSFLIFQRGGLKDFNNKGYSDIGSPSAKGTLKIKGPIIYKDIEMFFPPPFDLVKEEKERRLMLILLNLIDKPNLFISDYSCEKILVNKSNKNVKEPEGWLSQTELKNYLTNKEDYFLTVPEKEFYEFEHKVGIARDIKTSTTKEGYLYRFPMIRLKKDTALIIDIECVDNFPENGILQLGGEGKSANFEKLNEDKLEELKNIDFKFENCLFKIYLATPAIFKKGWLPDWVDEKTLEGNFNGIRLKLVACAVGRHIPVGGWDIANRDHKPMIMAVPAGSVYYFKIMDDTNAKEIKGKFHFKNISDINPEEGFGLSLIGEVKI